MTETEETEPEPVEAESVSPMLDDLEKDLEETVATLPSGQLSEEQKKLFAYFTSVRGMNQQLAALWKRIGCAKSAGRILCWAISSSPARAERQDHAGSRYRKGTAEAAPH